MIKEEWHFVCCSSTVLIVGFVSNIFKKNLFGKSGLVATAVHTSYAI